MILHIYVPFLTVCSGVEIRVYWSIVRHRSDKIVVLGGLKQFSKTKTFFFIKITV